MMQYYIGVKLVEAEPMTRLDYNLVRGWNMPENECGTDEGYLFRYPDGYVSWSPKNVFEQAYLHIGENDDADPKDMADRMLLWEDSRPAGNHTMSVTLACRNGMKLNALASMGDCDRARSAEHIMHARLSLFNRVAEYMAFVREWAAQGLLPPRKEEADDGSDVDGIRSDEARD